MLAEKGSSKQITQKDIDVAATKVLGEKKCFNCQTWKKLHEGSQIKKLNKVQWRCFRCQGKNNIFKGQS